MEGVSGIDCLTYNVLYYRNRINIACVAGVCVRSLARLKECAIARRPIFSSRGSLAPFAFPIRALDINCKSKLTNVKKEVTFLAYAVLNGSLPC